MGKVKSHIRQLKSGKKVRVQKHYRSASRPAALKRLRRTEYHLPDLSVESLQDLIGKRAVEISQLENAIHIGKRELRDLESELPRFSGKQLESLENDISKLSRGIKRDTMEIARLEQEMNILREVQDDVKSYFR